MDRQFLSMGQDVLWSYSTVEFFQLKKCKIKAIISSFSKQLIDIKKGVYLLAIFQRTSLTSLWLTLKTEYMK